MRRRSAASRSASPPFSIGLAHSSLNSAGRGCRPGRDDRQQRPEVHQRVLERRAGDGELGPRGEPPHRLVGLGLVVLDELGLVEHDRAPRPRPEGDLVDAGHGIRGDDDLRARDGGLQAAPGLVAGAVDDHRAQRRREPGRLALPRGQHRGRGHDEHRVVELAALVRPQHHGEHLQRLAQAHVVGEHPAEPAVPEQRQPAEAVDLVGPQGGVEPGGQLGRLDRVEVEQRPHRAGPPVGLLLDHAERRELLPQPGVHHRDAQRVGGLVLQRARLVDQGAQGLELGAVEGEPGAAVEDEVLVPAGDRLDERGQRHVLTRHGHRDAEVEPVGGRAVDGVGGRHLDERRVDRLAVGRGLADDGELERGNLFEHRQQLGERHRGEAVQPHLGHQSPHLRHDLPQPVEPGDLVDLEQPLDQRALGRPVAHRVGLLGGHRHQHPAGDRAVAEPPLEVGPVPRLVGDAQREPRRHGIRQVEVAGRGPHPCLAPQPGQVGDREAGPVGLGHLDHAEVEQPLAGAVERLGEGTEHEGLAVAQPEPGGGLPDQGGAAGGALGQVEAGVQLGALVGAHDVDDQLGRLGHERDLAALGEVGEQPHPGAVGRAQQRHPRRAEVVEQDGVGHAAVAEGPHRAAVGVGQRREGVAVLVGEGHPAEAVVATGEGLPRHPGADPAAAHARHHGADAQLGAGRLVAPRPGGRLDEEADLGVLGLEVVVVEQAAEGALPGGPRGCGGAADGVVDERLLHPRLGRHGHGVLAVAPDRARAGAGPAAQLEPADARGRDRGERDGGGVGLAVAAADPAGGVRAVVGQLELDDPALLGVGEAARDGDRATHLVELTVGEVGEAVDGEHPCHHTTSATRPPDPAGPIPEPPTVCRAPDIPLMSSTALGPRGPGSREAGVSGAG